MEAKAPHSLSLFQLVQPALAQGSVVDRAVIGTGEFRVGAVVLEGEMHELAFELVSGWLI